MEGKLEGEDTFECTSCLAQTPRSKIGMCLKQDIFLFDWTINGKKSLFIRPGQLLVGKIQFWDFLDVEQSFDSVKNKLQINHEILTNTVSYRLNSSIHYNITQHFSTLVPYRFNKELFIIPNGFVSDEGLGDTYLSQVTLMDPDPLPGANPTRNINLNPNPAIPSISFNRRDVVIKEPRLNFTFKLDRLPELSPEILDDLSLILDHKFENFTNIYYLVDKDIERTRLLPHQNIPLTLKLENIEAVGETSNYKLVVFQFVKMGYEYAWVPLTSYFGNGKHSKNIDLEFYVIGGGWPGALGRNSYTQLFNLENPQEDSHLSDDTLREQTLKFRVSMLGDFAETERRFELKLTQSHSILSDLRYLYLSGKYQEE